MTTRRALLGATPALLLPGWVGAATPDDAVTALRRGAVAVLLRHAQTDPGIGDPAGFRPGVCRTQRNLSAEGRAQARTIGQWFASRGLRPAAVRSSAWCRCLDTATLAFGEVQPWPALDSFFGDASTAAAQTAELRSALARLPRGAFEVWVTHMVNITALTGEGVGMGEAGLVEAAVTPTDPADGVRTLARLNFEL